MTGTGPGADADGGRTAPWSDGWSIQRTLPVPAGEDDGRAKALEAALAEVSAALAHDLSEEVRNALRSLELARRDDGGRAAPSARHADPDAGSASPEVAPDLCADAPEGGADAAVAHLRRLDRLVRDLVRYCEASAVDAPTAGDADAGRVLEDVLATLAPRLVAAGAVVSWDDLPRVALERRWLARVLHALLDNALKHHGRDGVPAGHDGDGPRIHVGWRRGLDPGTVTLRVYDDGPGIPPEDRGRALALFRQGGGAHGGPGTGLGLALVRRVVEAHGGRVDLRSAPGQGTVVALTLPAAQ